jgi:hypothetical protein
MITEWESGGNLAFVIVVSIGTMPGFASTLTFRVEGNNVV